MLRFEILTLFPQLFESFSSCGLISRAISEGLLELHPSQLRDFCVNTHGQVDDTPFGGGSGMVLRPDAGVPAIEAAKKRLPCAKVILFTPRGVPFKQELAKELASGADDECRDYILVCSRYEGVDQRIIDHWVDFEVSLGDYVLMGAEVAAMSLIEATSRLVPGVLGNPNSIVTESFAEHLLEYPQYTKPRSFRDIDVPGVLLSGNHKDVESWRRDKSVEDTISRRPDLITRDKERSCPLAVALLHSPVVDKQGDIITSSITNIDLHDIARSACTYGVDSFYVAHPVKTMRRLVNRICTHWEQGFGAEYNPNRKQALRKISLVADLDDIILDIENKYGCLPRIIATSARKQGSNVSFAELSAILRTQEEPHLLLLGTGWGLAEEIISRAQYMLEPISGPTDYNHLSVRAALAIMLDRLLGR